MKKTYINEKSVVFDAGMGAGVEFSEADDGYVNFYMSGDDHVRREDWLYDRHGLRALSKIMTEAADQLDAGVLFEHAPSEIEVDGVTYVRKV